MRTIKTLTTKNPQINVTIGRDVDLECYVVAYKIGRNTFQHYETEDLGDAERTAEQFAKRIEDPHTTI
jgi:hypothetical protein